MKLPKITPGNKDRVICLLMRLVSLGSKLVLTLYMGRYLDLAAIGIYGLVFSAVVFMTAFLGQEFSYVVKREIVGLNPEAALYKLRDQTIWYGVNYAFAIALAVIAVLGQFTDVPARYVYISLFLGIVESLGATYFKNMNLLEQQVAATFSHFIRSAAWVPVAIALGFVSPSYRTPETILLCWAVGSFLSLGVPLWRWRNWGWRKVIRKPVAWAWIFKGLRQSGLIWFGALGFMAGNYVDRTFVDHYLGLEYVGVMTFYYSFINAILPLAESGALMFTAPRLISAHQAGDEAIFWREAIGGAKQVGLGVAALVLCLAVFVPLLGHVLGKPAFVDNVGTFWLLLVSGWIQAVSLVVYYILFAKGRDGPIWIGSLLFVVPVIIGNALFVPIFGLPGIGLAAIFAALSLFAWRLMAVFRPLSKKKITRPS